MADERGKSEALRRKLEAAEGRASNERRERRELERAIKEAEAEAPAEIVRQELAGGLATLAGAYASGHYRARFKDKDTNRLGELGIGAGAVILGHRMRQPLLMRAGVGFASRVVAEAGEKHGESLAAKWKERQAAKSADELQADIDAFQEAQRLKVKEPVRAI
jgi:hypothetical protein